MKAELEAQWRGTEKQSERIAELEKEKEELRGEVEALNARIGDMEVEWAQSENRKNELEAEAQELWATKEDLEKERDEVSLYDLVVSGGANVHCVRSSRSSSAPSKNTRRGSPPLSVNVKIR